MIRNLLLATTAAAVLPASAGVKYEITLTNGGSMPVSPAVVYAGAPVPNTAPGQNPTAGFIRLCQTGNPADRAQEISNEGASHVVQTPGPILPGQSQTVEVEVKDPTKQSIHFEAMYGKSKDACASVTVGSHALVALKQHVAPEVLTRDSVLVTGAFTVPSLPAAGAAYACTSAADAVTCLRELSSQAMAVGKIRYFAGYLPSVVEFLEQKYGAAETDTLLIPNAGALQVRVKLKH